MDVPVKYPYVGGTKWAFWKWADIPDARDEKRTYLRRLRIVQTPWFALYLHFIFLPDEDRDPHDHPFVFWSWILRGGYTERLFGVDPGKHRNIDYRYKTWRRWSLHKMPQTQAHMIDQLSPDTVTLVLCGAKTRDWGFYVDTGFVPWQRYNREKYMGDPAAHASEPF